MKNYLITKSIKAKSVKDALKRDAEATVVACVENEKTPEQLEPAIGLTTFDAEAREELGFKTKPKKKR